MSPRYRHTTDRKLKPAIRRNQLHEKINQLRKKNIQLSVGLVLTHQNSPQRSDYRGLARLPSTRYTRYTGNVLRKQLVSGVFC